MRAFIVLSLLFALVALAVSAKTEIPVEEDTRVPEQAATLVAPPSITAKEQELSKQHMDGLSQAGWRRRRRYVARRRRTCEEEIAPAELLQRSAKVLEDTKDIGQKGELTQAGWRRRRRARRRRRYVNWCAIRKERSAKERRSKYSERINKERANKERSRKYWERINKERANKERSRKYWERINKERANKERINKERSRKERAGKERNAKERVAKERAAKERVSKERTRKERVHKDNLRKEKIRKEKGVKERSGKERRTKELKKKRELAYKRMREQMAKKHERSAKKQEKKKKEVGAKVRKERANKVERGHKERTRKVERANKRKERAAKERSAKERAVKERNAKEKVSKEAKAKERKVKEKRSKEKKAKEKRAKVEKKVKAVKKERHGKEKKAKEKNKKEMGAKAKHITRHRKQLANTIKRCKAHATNVAKGMRAILSHSKAAARAFKHSATTCKRQKAREKKTKERRAKHGVKGPSFKFHSNPCKGGKGSFTRKMKMGQRVTIGNIPANQYNVKVQLRTNKDVDTELWVNHGKREIAIIAWQVGKINSATAATMTYAGAKIKYSGYNGIKGKKGGLNFGHEDIGIKGKASVGFVMKAYAFEAGTARITYSWGVDPAVCKAARAKRRKEKKAKHAAKLALKKKLSEKALKAATATLHGSSKSCAGTKRFAAAARTNVKKARSRLGNSRKALAKCHKRRLAQRKHLNKLMKKHASRKKKGGRTGHGLGCFDTKPRGRLGWRYKGRTKSLKSARAWCRGYKYMSFECPTRGGYEVFCLNKPSSGKLPFRDCQGKPSVKRLNNARNGHCKGPYKYGSVWGGGWHRGVLYRAKKEEEDDEFIESDTSELLGVTGCRKNCMIDSARHLATCHSGTFTISGCGAGIITKVKCSGTGVGSKCCGSFGGGKYCIQATGSSSYKAISFNGAKINPVTASRSCNTLNWSNKCKWVCKGSQVKC